MIKLKKITSPKAKTRKEQKRLLIHKTDKQLVMNKSLKVQALVFLFSTACSFKL